MEERITMSLKDIERLEVLNRIKEKPLKQSKGAQILDIIPRQVRRLLCRLKDQEPKGIVSKRVGAPSNNQLEAEAKDRILDFFKDIDHFDFEPTLAHEYLIESGASFSISSVRNVMIRNRLWHPKAIRKLKIHPLRPRSCRHEIKNK